MEIDPVHFVSIAVSAIVGLGTYFSLRHITTKVNKEKAKRVEKDVITALSRGIIQQNLNPSLEEVQWMIEAKSRQYEASPRMVSDPKQLLKEIYTEIMETDYISPKEKKKHLSTIKDITKTVMPPAKRGREIKELKEQIHDIRNSLVKLTSKGEGELERASPEIIAQAERLSNMENMVDEVYSKQIEAQLSGIYKVFIRILLAASAALAVEVILIFLF
jgi:hypothetical protein